MPEQSRKPASCDTFWAWAHSLWNDPHARDTLLRWQDRYAVDVILALFALWYPHALRYRQWKILQATARHWHDTRTGRIRALRQHLYSPQRHALYRALLDLELRAERMAAWLLCTRARDLAPVAVPHDAAARLGLLFPALPAHEIRDALHSLSPHRVP